MLVSHYFTLRRMPTGRYAFALRRMRDLADEEDQDRLLVPIDRAVEQAQVTQSLDFTWTMIRGNTSTARGNAVAIDNDIDEMIAAIEQKVSADVVGDDDDPVSQAATEFLASFFPEGVAAITQREFEVQLGIMDTMMARIDDEFTDHVEMLHLDRQLDRLRRLIEDFRAELDLHSGPEVTFDQVRAARAKLHDLTCKVQAAVIVELDGDDEECVQIRNKILRPLDRQQELVAEARSRHRVVTDIDPETGEALVDDDPTDDES